jgi:drug/metabolite transporter (DMT)-like permease
MASIKNPSHSLIPGYLFALCATAVWSGNFIVARGLSDTIPPITLAFCRWAVATAALTPFAAKRLMAEWPVVRAHPVYFCMTSFLGITAFNTLIYIAGQTTTALNLSLIAITFPVFILIISRILYHEPITAKKIAGILLVLCGVVLLITNGRPDTLLTISFNKGDLWMLAASLIFAVYSICLKNKPATISIRGMQLSTFIIGLLLLLPFFLWEQSGVTEPFLNYTTVPAILYVGIFASLCAYLLWNKSVMILGPARAGMIYYTLPLFSGALGYLFLKESIRLMHLNCLILIVAGIVITNYGAEKKQ